jgi:aspartyl-tRNA synthetase
MGWVHHRRNFGQLIFLTCAIARASSRWFSIPICNLQLQAKVKGRPAGIGPGGARECVRAAPAGQANPEMPTGEIEVVARELKILNGGQSARHPDRRARRYQRGRAAYKMADSSIARPLSRNGCCSCATAPARWPGII